MTAECHKEQGSVQGAWPLVSVVLGAASGQRVGGSHLPFQMEEFSSDPTGLAWGWAGPRLESGGPDPKPLLS